MADQHRHHDHSDHHHHHVGHVHPPAQVRGSILRLSALERLAAAALAIVVVWAAVLWAMR
jgi:hypothetical protein